MREILFRGKRPDNGEWAYGYYCSFKGSSDIFVPFTEEEEKRNEGHIFSAVGGLWYKVIPETVGQFTGLTDKNGTKIFEGDVVAYCWYEAEPMNFRIDFVCGEFLAVPVKKREDVWAIRISGQGENLEIIGNIHDNPELLEG